MKLNPYQKIIKDGVLIQPGQIDTPVKFGQLTQGIDLQGKTVLDVGCNLGAMCNIATVNGATTRGIDINREYIKQAKSLFPNLIFQCLPVERIYYSYDIIIASAMLHYVENLDNTLKLFSRCAKQVLCDIWLNDSPDTIFTLSHRGIYIPSRSAFLNIAGKYFSIIEEKGLALTPDQSKRYIFHLSDSTAKPPEAILIYGEGGTGKTTLASTHFNHKFLMLDNVYISWNITNRNNTYSVKWNAHQIRGEKLDGYNKFFIDYLNTWLAGTLNLDIVIEGYELIFDSFRNQVVEILEGLGWKVNLIHLTEKYYKDYT